MRAKNRGGFERYVAVSSALLCLNLLSVRPSPAYSQDVLHTTILEGRTIQLLSNHTWRYSEHSSVVCDYAYFDLKLCFGPEWTIVHSRFGANGGEMRLKNADPSIEAKIISEARGEFDGVTYEFAKRAILANLSRANGPTPGPVTVFSVVDDAVAGHPSKLITYGGWVLGFPAVYMNTILIRPRATHQFIVYTPGSSPSLPLADKIKSLLSSIEIR